MHQVLENRPFQDQYRLVHTHVALLLETYSLSTRVLCFYPYLCGTARYYNLVSSNIIHQVRLSFAYQICMNYLDRFLFYPFRNSQQDLEFQNLYLLIQRVRIFLLEHRRLWALLQKLLHHICQVHVNLYRQLYNLVCHRMELLLGPNKISDRAHKYYQLCLCNKNLLVAPNSYQLQTYWQSISQLCLLVS